MFGIHGKVERGRQERMEERWGRGRARRGRRSAAVVAIALGAAAAGCGSDSEERRTSSFELTPRSTSESSAVGSHAIPAESTTPIVDPIESPVTYEEAEAAFRAGGYELAVSLFDRYSERVPTNPWGFYMLGISAWRDGNHERAEIALRRTLDVDPEHTKARLNLARVLLEQGKPSEALEFALAVTEKEPGLGEGWRVLGNVHADLELPDAAAVAYRMAITIDPLDSWTMNNLGLLRIREGRYGDAIPPLARATELRPEVATFQNNLGIALERNGRMALAVNAYGAALVADSTYEKARMSFDRVSGLVALSTMPPIDLSVMASSFASEVEGWTGTTVATRPEEIGSVEVEPGDVETDEVDTDEIGASGFPGTGDSGATPEVTDDLPTSDEVLQEP